MYPLSFSVDCPACKASLKRRELLHSAGQNVSSDKKKSTTVWQALSSPEVGLNCPQCKTLLRPTWRSFWPLLLLIPALLAYQLLPILWATVFFIMTGLIITILLRFGMQYKPWHS